MAQGFFFQYFTAYTKTSTIFVGGTFAFLIAMLRDTMLAKPINASCVAF